MHQYRTIVQTLLVLSILNLVYASPVVPQEIRDTGNDVVVAEDVTNGSGRRRGAPPGGTTGTTPSQYPPSLSDGSLSAAWNLLYQKTNRLNTEASTSAHPLSAAGGPPPPPVPDSNAEASTSSLVPEPASSSTAQGSKAPHYAKITPEMLHKDPYKRPLAKKLMGYGLIVATVTGVVLLTLHNNHKNSTGG